jgi:hypothetical protein
MARFAAVSCVLSLRTAHRVSRDCLAPAGTTAGKEFHIDPSIPTGPAMSMNKNKTCYKCQQEGHVGPFLTRFSRILIQVTRLPENALRMLILWDEFLH